MGVIDYSIRRRVAALEARIAGGNVVDLGVVRATDLLANGETVLYTPSGTDCVLITPAPADFEAIAHQTFYVKSDSTANIAELSGSVTNVDQIPIPPARVYTTDPIYAVLTTDGLGLIVETPPPVWASLHVYAASFIIHGPDAHLWSSGAGGTSAGSIPDFAGNEGGTVVDGSVTWADEGHVPTTGALHLYAIVTPLG